MQEIAYHQTCPICGQQLSPLADGPWTPPWGCFECKQAWWVAELTVEARMAFRRDQRDFGHQGTETHKAVREAVRIEAEQANIRGISLRREQLGLVPKTCLEGLLVRHPKTHQAFAAQMKQIVAN